MTPTIEAFQALAKLDPDDRVVPIQPTVTYAELAALTPEDLVNYEEGQYAACRAARRARNATTDTTERNRLQTVRFTALANANMASNFRAQTPEEQEALAG